MIHYHGTPLSGPLADRSRFYAGRHALVSFAYKDDLAVVSEMCQSFVFDNGAFTVWKQGGKLDTAGYYDWVSEWYKHPGFDWALIPDDIEGDEASNDRLLKQWPAHLNRVGVPVWHLHESTDRLKRLAQNYSIVALGSSGEFSQPNSAKWWVKMAEAMDAVCDEQGRPPCRLHGLRMLNPKVFSKLPLASADSTNAAVNAGSKGRFGIYLPVTASQRACVIADRVESFNSAKCWGHTAEQSVFDDQVDCHFCVQGA